MNIYHFFFNTISEQIIKEMTLKISKNLGTTSLNPKCTNFYKEKTMKLLLDTVSTR